MGLEITLTPETRGPPEPPPHEPAAPHFPQPRWWAIHHGKPQERQGRGWGQLAAMGFLQKRIAKKQEKFKPSSWNECRGPLGAAETCCL